MDVKLPSYVVSGDAARLFPVLAETSKERRITSIFLAVAIQVPELLSDLLATLGVRLGKTSKVEAYTEVVFRKHDDTDCRPDGLLIVKTGSREWRALIEAKISSNILKEDQVTKYLEIARDNEIDAVITISNQFVAHAKLSPLKKLDKRLLKKVDLFHWSWTWISTLCQIIEYQGKIEDMDKVYLLEHLNDFLKHPSTGVERFTQMPASWPTVVTAVRNQQILHKSSHDVEEVVSGWFAEERDLCLRLSTHIGLLTQTVIERKLKDDFELRLQSASEMLCSKLVMESIFRVPDCASDIVVTADLVRKTVSCCMSLRAAEDKKSTKARVNWLIKMLPVTDVDLQIRAHWPGRILPTMVSVNKLREDPEAIQCENPKLAPHSFDVLSVHPLSKRFGGRKTFIQDLESVVPEFYTLVASNLKAWQAPPPKPIKVVTSPVEEEILEEPAQET